MAANQKSAASAMEIDRLATQLAKDPQSKAFLPLAEEYCKVGMWEEAVGVLEDGLKYYPGFITAMVALGRAYDQLNQPTKAKAVLEAAVKLSPDNLRAHRTLIKIYKTQGLTEDALKSCRVILAMNPRDEEARSVQASLRVAANQESETPKPPAPIQAISPAPAPEPPMPFTPTVEPTFAFAETPTAALKEPALGVEEPVLTLDDSASTNSPIGPATGSLETALHKRDDAQVEDRSAADPLTERAGSVPRPSRNAGTIVRLESWLQSIDRQRRDRAIPGDLNS